VHDFKCICFQVIWRATLRRGRTDRWQCAMLGKPAAARWILTIELEGHAPSWPRARAHGRDRSASLQYRRSVAAAGCILLRAGWNQMFLHRERSLSARAHYKCSITRIVGNCCGRGLSGRRQLAHKPVWWAGALGCYRRTCIFKADRRESAIGGLPVREWPPASSPPLRPRRPPWRCSVV